METKKPHKMRPPMRSSIACTNCRRSKIKCENSGGPNPGSCDSCVKSGKECLFKLPDPAPPKRSEPPVGVKQEREGGSDRKKLKKIDDISKIDTQRASFYAGEVLAAAFLTEDVWDQVFDIYKLHFAPELPFLHLPTMKEKTGRKTRTSQSEPNSDINLVLLGVLTLTARFHPELVKYIAHVCTNQPGNARTRPLQTQFDPAAASEYYAEVLSMALGPMRSAMSIASVDRVAALLMLGLYEWSQTLPKTGALTAWMYVGYAIRMAQYLGLGFEDVEDARSKPQNAQPRNSGSQSQVALQKEINRRVMFSCFILDRMLACGKNRVSTIQPHDMQIQLPCSENNFDLAMEVHTGFLRNRGGPGTDDSVLSRFISLVDLWGDISKFSSRGGRFTQGNTPPWSPQSRFYVLNEALQVFDSDLPGTFTFSRSNYFKHENHQASSTYVLLHMLRCLCLIMLHREYVPFVPIRCQEPEGPLDRPVFTKEETPDGFWIRSAEQLFRAARDIVDLIEICQRKGKLPQSTIVLFAIYTAAFVGLYAVHFPQMDTGRHMLESDPQGWRSDNTKDVFREGPTAVAYETLRVKMSGSLKMATSYVDLLMHMDTFFLEIKQDYMKHSSDLGQQGTTTRVRKGGTGGALEEWKQHVSAITDMGALHPNEHRYSNFTERSRAAQYDRTSSGETENLELPAINSGPKSAPPGSFTAINRTPTLPTTEIINRPLSRETVAQGPPTETHPDSWRYQNSMQATHPSPAQAYPTPGSMFDMAALGIQVRGQSVIQDHAGDWMNTFERTVAPKRLAAIGDLTMLAGEYMADMPFGDQSWIPPMPESTLQYLQQANEYEELESAGAGEAWAHRAQAQRARD